MIIGSELIGITSIKDSANNFLAVLELINLARLVKKILGSNVQVTYAADWSEYHHTSGGWYNLDPLFASPYIDFVGIDAYFPLTNSLSSQITKEEIMKGCHTGEGYDYYLDGNGNKQPLSAAYTWKNVDYWWKNHYYNPDGKRTAWEPKMKKNMVDRVWLSVNR
ncbi:baseplate megatron protein TIM-barrel domain-containing protein [Rickettsia australis]|uniref:baseplate megatron protein TIM-barrel domain-containing protein n=1 Tax=Rickettsia australis TaxID=787 RepID=UPI00031CCC63|nr:glycoside hydrolase TIM-barrel-like domain-containing protein [Rickettsia australis]